MPKLTLLLAPSPGGYQDEQNGEEAAPAQPHGPGVARGAGWSCASSSSSQGRAERRRERGTCLGEPAGPELLQLPIHHR